jgi:hypothetical protein
MSIQKISTLGFIVREHDALAPDTIKHWIKLAKARRVNQAKIDNAMNHLAAIEEWQRTHPTLV